MINQSSLLTIFAIIVGLCTIVGTIKDIILNWNGIVNVKNQMCKFLVDKELSIGSKIRLLKNLILLSSVEIMKAILLLSSGILSVYYMKLSDSCLFKWAIYSTAIPNLQNECKSITDTNLLWVSVIFLVYFFCLLYVFSYEKKKSKKMDDDFIPYPIKIENEKK